VPLVNAVGQLLDETARGDPQTFSGTLLGVQLDAPAHCIYPSGSTARPWRRITAGDAKLDHVFRNFKDAADIYKKVSNAQLHAFVPGILP
jgi:hypothetical protein